MKKLFENWNKFLTEDADPSKLDPRRFPTKLSVVAQNPQDAQADVSLGVKDSDPGGDDDKIPVNGATFKVSELAPSQSTMNVAKAVGMAIGHILKGKAGGDLGAFISNDKRIMDGHHRWISSYMVDPNAEIGGYAVNFPAAQLIPVLNAITVGKVGRLEGKPGKGSFSDFNAENIAKFLGDLYQNGNEYTPADKARAAIAKFSGVQGEQGVATAAKKMADNLSTATMNTPAGAPERIDMPVIDKKDIRNAIGLLQKGFVDVNPPYAARGGEQKKAAE
tara:strand:+ start:316 stop:1146 length:831 start_codon:yes stop_codon:yes gene_type:complete